MRNWNALAALDSLRAIEAAARHRSFTRPERRCFSHQRPDPRNSRSVGAALFHWRHRSLARPTPCGTTADVSLWVERDIDR